VKRRIRVRVVEQRIDWRKVDVGQVGRSINFLTVVGRSASFHCDLNNSTLSSWPGCSLQHRVCPCYQREIRQGALMESSESYNRGDQSIQFRYNTIGSDG
jgi:hypothetical protein